LQQGKFIKIKFKFKKMKLKNLLPTKKKTQTDSSLDQASQAQASNIKKSKTISLKLAIISSLCFAVLFSGLSLLASWAIINNHLSSKNNVKQRQEIISSEGDIFNRIASEVGKSVVSIVTTESTGSSAAGTGVVINNKGLILTNKHVIPSSTTQIEVVDHTNTKHSAKVLGRDPNNDIAFVEVADLPETVPAATLADSSQVKVGDKVLAIGNALGEFQNTVTSGIVSGIGRPIEVSDQNSQNYESLFNLIQTDAAINPGNSGGPLVNLSGEVIGINTAIVQDAQSLGFSIPINDAKGLISQVEQNGNLGSRAYLGVRYLNLTSAIAQSLNLQISEGALIYDSRGNPIETNSPASQAGLKQYDVITSIGGNPINQTSSLSSTLAKFKPNQDVELTIYRRGTSY
jgi:S1-C subfamily serine protease